MAAVAAGHQVRRALCGPSPWNRRREAANFEAANLANRAMPVADECLSCRALCGAGG